MEAHFVAAVSWPFVDPANTVDLHERTVEIGSGVDYRSSASLTGAAVAKIDPFGLSLCKHTQSPTMTLSSPLHDRYLVSTGGGGSSRSYGERSPVAHAVLAWSS